MSQTLQTTKTKYNPDNGKTDVHLVTSKKSVLLQTTTAIVSDNKEKRQLPVKALLDPGAQRTYLSQSLVDYLTLAPIDKQTITIKTFGNENENSVELKKYSFCVRGMSGGQTKHLSSRFRSSISLFTIKWSAN